MNFPFVTSFNNVDRWHCVGKLESHSRSDIANPPLMLPRSLWRKHEFHFLSHEDVSGRPRDDGRASGHHLHAHVYRGVGQGDKVADAVGDAVVAAARVN
jgi:hypothetical protein